MVFGFADSLALLYAARLLGGLFASATLPAAAAYVADTTAAEDRTSRMAWLGTAVSLGAMAGPALGGLLAGASGAGHTLVGGTLITAWAVPYFGAAGVTALAFLMAVAWMPESPRASRPALAIPGSSRPSGRALRILLVLGVAAQFGHAMFETTFALYASRMWRYGPAQVGLAFMVCGLVMAVAQTAVSGPLARRFGELPLVAAGFTLLGGSLAILPSLRAMTTVLLAVATLGLGLALVAPTIAALVAASGGVRRGAAFGAQSAANSLGQVSGTIAGGALLAWRMEAPYLVAAAVLLLIGAAAGAAAARGVQGNSFHGVRIMGRGAFD